METKMNGGPAFPTYHGGYTKCDTEGGGMTLRDYFAAKAMHGTISFPDIAMTKEEIAVWSYKMADEMLKARNASCKCFR